MNRPSSAPRCPAPEQVARTVFGDRYELAVAFADLLAGPGVTRGLIGPREADRIWSRHLLNCAVLGELVEADVEVLDVGSGAGLPGIPLAIARADLAVTLLEPMARRVTFLVAAVAELGLGNVRVVRGRAEDPAVRRAVRRRQVLTARAVAPLPRLVGWCRPLLAPGGRLLAIKGDAAAAEVEQSRDALRSAGIADHRVVLCGVGMLDIPTTVVELRA